MSAEAVGGGVPDSEWRDDLQARWLASIDAQIVRLRKLRHQILESQGVEVRGRKSSQRNRALCEDYERGITGHQLADRYGITTQRVSQILRTAGIDPAVRHADILAEQRAEREAQRIAERTVTCRTCGKEFIRAGNNVTCSDACATALRLGRRYLDPAFYEKQRHYQGFDGEPNRRFIVRGSKVTAALIAAGRADVLPSSAPPKQSRPKCAATNLNGTACRRNAGPDDDLCHIHRAQVEGRRLGGRKAS